MATPRLADLLARREQVAIERDALTLRLRRIDGEIALLMAKGRGDVPRSSDANPR